MSRPPRPLSFPRDVGWHVLVNGLAASVLLPRSLRCALYRLVGLDIRTNKIDARVFFFGRRTSIGDSFVNRGVRFHNLAPVEIGDRCSVGMEAMFVTNTHEIGSREKRAGPGRALPIRVGDGCWIGARAMILPGVSIGPGCVIAAGAVVAEDCAPNGLYGGVPARRIRELD